MKAFLYSIAVRLPAGTFTTFVACTGTFEASSPMYAPSTVGSAFAPVGDTVNLAKINGTEGASDSARGSSSFTVSVLSATTLPPIRCAFT